MNKELKERSIYFNMVLGMKYQRDYKLSFDQYYVLNHIRGVELFPNFEKVAPLTDTISVRSIRYYYKTLYDKGFLTKNANGYVLSAKSKKMYREFDKDCNMAEDTFFAKLK